MSLFDLQLEPAKKRETSVGDAVVHLIFTALSLGALISTAQPLKTELLVTTTVLAEPVADSDLSHWIHPVDAVIVDWFRLPEKPYGPGNRGLEYASRSGQPVWAVASGKVIFAGLIADETFVVLEHSDGLKSTYAYLQSAEVERGQRLEQGDTVGTGAPGFHLTARLGSTYIDPIGLIDGQDLRFRVRLIPLP